MNLKNTLLVVILFLSGMYKLSAQTEGEDPLAKKKGYVALLFSYSNTQKDNSKSLVDNVKHSDVTNFSVRSGAGIFLARHLAVGLNFDYGSEKENSESINTFGPNTITLSHLNTYTFTPFFRSYFSLGVKNRFFLFTQIGLEYGFGNGSDSTSTGTTTTYADIRNTNYGIAFTPGVIFLVKNGFAFEVNVGVLGFNHSKETTTPTDDDRTVIKKTDFDFNINLLSLSLGLSYYF